MATPPDYRFARRPIWLLGHIVLVVSVVVFVALGLWQLDRQRQRDQLDARISERLVDAARPLDELMAAHGADPQGLVLRRAEAVGVYVPSEEVILRARTLNGVSGHDVLTPLVVGDRALIVDRGWVPIDVVGPPVVGAEPPSGEVVVIGVILEGQTRGRFGPTDPDDGTLERISRVDIGRLDQQTSLSLYPFYLQLETQTPSQASGAPLPQPTPEPGGGPPHLAYAVQWFVFAAVALVGYPILIARTARRQRPGRSLEQVS